MADNFKYHIIPQEDSGSKEIFLEYFLGKSPEEAEEVYKEFSILLNKMSYSYSSNSGIEKRDIFSEALVGLARAKRDYDSSRSDNFKNYAIIRIKSAINDFIKRSSEIFNIPAYIKLANSNIVAVKSILFSNNISEEDINYVFNVGNLDNIYIDNSLKERCEKHIENLKRAATRAGIGFEELVRRSEYIPSSNEYKDKDSSVSSVESEVFDKIMIDKLKSKMNAVDRDIAQRILNGQSYKEIGDAYNKTRSWAINRMSRFGDKMKDIGLLK